MATVVKTTFQFKRGTAQRWMEVDPILKQGEPGFEYDTGKLKIGDGVTAWSSLKYINNVNISSDDEIIVVTNFSNLPATGDASKLYRVVNDKLLYQWNAQDQLYEPLGAQGSFDPSTINLINGGNANG